MLLLTLRETYTLNRLSSFQNLTRKGGKFDHRPERPTVLRRHCIDFTVAVTKRSLSTRVSQCHDLLCSDWLQTL